MSQISIFILSGPIKTTTYQVIWGLHTQKKRRSITCALFLVKQAVWMQLSTITVELCKEPFFFFGIVPKKNFKMTVWPQYSIFNQYFEITWIIMKFQNSLLEKKKVSWPFAFFLESMEVLNMSINSFSSQEEADISFLSLSLYLGRPLWLHQQTKYGRNDPAWVPSLGSKKPCRFCQFFLGQSLSSPEPPF